MELNFINRAHVHFNLPEGEGGTDTKGKKFFDNVDKLYHFLRFSGAFLYSEALCK